MNAAEVVKMFAKQDIAVNMPKLDKSGSPVRDKESGRIVTENQVLAAEHVVGVSERDGGVSITVADGRKYFAKVAVK